MKSSLSHVILFVVVSASIGISFAASQSGGTSTGILDFFYGVSSSAASSENGLETDDYRNISVITEQLPDDADTIGLTEEMIQNRTELRLLESNSRPTNGMTDPDYSRPYFYVQVTTVGNAYSINIAFIREAYFDADPKFYRTSAKTWTTGSVGSHGGSSAYILESLDSLIDAFLKDYLTANIE